MLETERLDSLVSKEEIFDGEPVFVGTRVPVRTVATFLDDGESVQAVLECFPSLTVQMIAVAQEWTRLHPREGRPRRFGEINPGWTIRISKTVKLTPP